MGLEMTWKFRGGHKESLPVKLQSTGTGMER